MRTVRDSHGSTAWDAHGCRIAMLKAREETDDPFCDPDVEYDRADRARSWEYLIMSPRTRRGRGKRMSITQTHASVHGERYRIRAPNTA